MQGHLSLSGLSISSGMLVNRPGLKVKVGDSRDSSARHDDCSPLHQGALPRSLPRPAGPLGAPGAGMHMGDCGHALLDERRCSKPPPYHPVDQLAVASEVSAVLRWT